MLQKEKITVPPNIKAPAVPFEEASGAIPYNMTNDYMFRIVLQENGKRQIMRLLKCL